MTRHGCGATRTRPIEGRTALSLMLGVVLAAHVRTQSEDATEKRMRSLPDSEGILP